MTTRSFTITGLPTNVKYDFFVVPLTAYKLVSDVTGPYSSVVTFTTPNVPSAPNDVKVEKDSVATDVKISWTNVTDSYAISSYNVKF